MDESKIRKIVQEELRRSQGGSRFGLNTIPFHTHDGVNSQQIKEESVIPATSVMGTVEFSQSATYILNLNASFTPRQVLINGIATGIYGGVAYRSIFSGVAVLTPSFYFQPSSTTSVITGNLQYPFEGVPAQNSSSISIFREPGNSGSGVVSNPVFATASEDHIVSIGIPTNNLGDIQARATVIGYSRTAIVVDIPILADDVSLFINYTIT